MPKQTAVQWLLQRFEDGDMYNVEDAQFIKHQALAMEKEQSKNDYKKGQESTKFKYPLTYEEAYKGGNNGI